MQLDLDIRDTHVLKGLAILAIILHNFFHVVSPARENEFIFHSTYFFEFVRASLRPDMAVQAFFSFFGYLGVDVFIFLSAYGLARSQWDSTSSWVSFLSSRCKKIFPVIGLVVLPWLFLACLHFGPVVFLKHYGIHLALMLIGLSTLVPGLGLPPVGPWWFIPYILQFYALFPLLRRFTVRLRWQGLALLALVGLTLTHLINPYLQPWSINLLTTPFGHMPSICFGIAAARFPIRLNAMLAFGSGALLILGSIYWFLWPCTFIAASILIIWIYLKAKTTLRQSGSLAWMGASSLLLFLLNGIVRIPLLGKAETPWSQLWAGLASLIVTLLITFVVEWLYPPSGGRLNHPGPKLILAPLAHPGLSPAKIGPLEPPPKGRVGATLASKARRRGLLLP